MSTIFLFHGFGGSPDNNWFPWLTKELKAAGHKVIAPKFPHPEEPKLTEWLNEFSTYRRKIDESTVLVGHSLGGAFAMRYLERAKTPVQATFLVASVFGVMGNDIDAHITTFNVKPYDYPEIILNGGNIHIVHSDNDPYIPLVQAEDASLKMITAMDVIPAKNHLTMSIFPQLREIILNSIV